MQPPLADIVSQGKGNVVGGPGPLAVANRTQLGPPEGSGDSPLIDKITCHNAPEILSFNEERRQVCNLTALVQHKRGGEEQWGCQGVS